MVVVERFQLQHMYKLICNRDSIPWQLGTETVVSGGSTVLNFISPISCNSDRRDTNDQRWFSCIWCLFVGSQRTPKESKEEILGVQSCHKVLQSSLFDDEDLVISSQSPWESTLQCSWYRINHWLIIYPTLSKTQQPGWLQKDHFQWQTIIFMPSNLDHHFRGHNLDK